MALTPGTRLGVFTITAQIGVGGMGEVYQATDTNLKRQVAIKVLPASVAGDADRLARFQREAEVLAALNHPNIAAIYGLEKTPDLTALVMELVEGDDLSQRIAKGAIPIDEALPIAKQIAEALEAAHEQGIIHRDLKPANIKVRSDGTVKVLDFGLAKALHPFPASEAAAVLANSPTITSPAMTQAGMILGTAAYMSPEQARGNPVDKRADLWAFGVVLYEMLTRERPFVGQDVTDTIAAVVRAEPDWSKLPAHTAPAIRRLLRRCLEKDRWRRLPDAAVARLEIDDALGPNPGETNLASLARDEGQGAVAVMPWRRALPWAAAGALGLGLATVLGFWGPWRTVPLGVPVRLSAEIGVDASLATDAGPAVVLSPDGARLAVRARGGDQQVRLYLRRLNQLEAVPLSGTEGAEDPFFSPDGQWIGFFAGGKLKKISVGGGAVATLCDAAAVGGSWSDDGTIVFGSRAGALFSVSSGGGTPEQLTTLDQQAGEVTHRWPQVLPGGKTILFTAGANTASASTISSYEDADVEVYSLATRQRKTLHRRGYYPRYLASGHLVYVSEGTLIAAPFDLTHLEVTGPAAPVLEGLVASPGSGAAQFSFSDTGNLVYVAGGRGDRNLSIYWMDREGTFTPLRETPAEYLTPAFSPDGKRLALEIADGKRSDIWVYDWERDTATRLTFTGQANRYPSWAPDGRRITYATREQDGSFGLFWMPADGGGAPQRLTKSRNLQVPTSWRPDGRVLAFHQYNLETATDIMTLSVEGNEASGWKYGEPKVFLNSAYDEWRAAFSPDGRWLAYTSGESGKNEVYVRPFPGPGGKWQISSGGGEIPTWSPNGKAIYFRRQNRIMDATYTASADTFRPDKPQPWSPAQIADLGTVRNFDLHPEGKRFAVLMPPGRKEAGRVDKVTFTFNFFDELRRRAQSK